MLIYHARLDSGESTGLAQRLNKPAEKFLLLPINQRKTVLESLQETGVKTLIRIQAMQELALRNIQLNQKQFYIK